MVNLFDFSFVICKWLQEKEGRQGRKGERKGGQRRGGEERGDPGSVQSEVNQKENRHSILMPIYGSRKGYR